jgi:hypothetical protein
MVPGTRKKEGFSAHLAVQMLRKKLKAAEAAGGPDIITGFFKEANRYMLDRKKEQEFEYLDSDSDTDSDLDMDQDIDSDSDVDMPLPPIPEPLPPTLEPLPSTLEPLPSTPEPLPPTPEPLPPTPEQHPPTPEPTPPPQEPLPIRLTIRRINGNFVSDGQVQVRRSARERIPNTMYNDYG